jgi:hypothetical protein
MVENKKPRLEVPGLSHGRDLAELVKYQYDDHYPHQNSVVTSILEYTFLGEL